MQKLKIDFHVHTGEDQKDRHIKYSAKQLLDKAAEYQFDAITIANHIAVCYTDGLQEYAEKRGILLIPGVEAYVEGKHVLIVNCRWLPRKPLSFKTLRSCVGEEALIIAPHPFFPREYCLKETLEDHIEVFDAIEYAHLHFRFINLNDKAVALAQKYDLPMVGTSDAHTLRQLNTTYSLVEARKTIPAIVEAVKQKRVEVVTRPMNTWTLFTSGAKFLLSSTKGMIRKNFSKRKRS